MGWFSNRRKRKRQQRGWNATPKRFDEERWQTPNDFLTASIISLPSQHDQTPQPSVCTDDYAPVSFQETYTSTDSGSSSYDSGSSSYDSGSGGGGFDSGGGSAGCD